MKTLITSVQKVISLKTSTKRKSSTNVSVYTFLHITTHSGMIKQPFELRFFIFKTLELYRYERI